eukprot:SAG22_NODE_138_length_18031_cov_5.796621_8_plen_388_part_00
MTVATLPQLLAALQRAAADDNTWGRVEILVRAGATIELAVGQSILIPANTTLRGKSGPGSDVPVLSWSATGRPRLATAAQAAAAWAAPFVTLGGVNAGLENLVLLRDNLPNPVAVVSVADGADGAQIVGVNATSAQTAGVYPPHTQVNWTLFVGTAVYTVPSFERACSSSASCPTLLRLPSPDSVERSSHAINAGRASGWVVDASHFKQDGPTPWSPRDGGDLGPDPSPCKLGYPWNTVFHLEAATDGAITNSTFEMGCEGWSAFSTRRVALIGNSFLSTGLNVSEGGAVTNSPKPPSTRYFAYLRNRIVLQKTAYHRFESFTSDGGIGGYVGAATTAASNRTAVRLASPGVCSRGMEWFPPPAHGPLDDDWAGGALVVLGGAYSGA